MNTLFLGILRKNTFGSLVKSCCILFVWIMAAFLSVSAHADFGEVQIISAPENDSDGNFTVSWTRGDESEGRCLQIKLDVFKDGALFSSEPYIACSTSSFQATNYLDGVYTFEIGTLVFDDYGGDGSGAEEFMNGFSAVTVVGDSGQGSAIIDIHAPEVDYDGNFTINWSYPPNITCTSFSLFIKDVTADDEISIYDPSQDCSVSSHQFVGRSDGEHEIFMLLEYIEYGVAKRATTTANTFVQDQTVIVLDADFENGFGNWTNTTPSWLMWQGSTPSSSTGPSSAATGNYYAYMETSRGYAFDNGDTARLTSEFVTVNQGTLSFNYHMFGNDIGELRVEVLIGGSWQTIWQQVGATHASSPQSWRKATIALEGYNQDYSKIRFVGIADGGFRGDIAIDNVVYRSLP